MKPRSNSTWRGRIVLLLALMSLTIAACTPAPPPPTSAPAASAAAPTQPTSMPRSGSGRELILATTTSTQDSGLLDVLVPLFERQSGYQVKTVSVGTGAALALGARGEADVVLVHAPEAEQKWMSDGNGTERVLVMHNDFIVVGPPGDPAGIKGEPTAIGALKKLADQGATWVSRDDNSGTDQLEKQLWRQAGVDPKGQPWYVTSGQGMGATLTLADQKEAYTISDRATYLARKGALQAQIMVEGDRPLLNIYHVMPVNPSKFPNVRINAAGGKAFADFLVTPDVQGLIGEFGKDRFGQQLFVPDAGKLEEQVGR